MATKKGVIPLDNIANFRDVALFTNALSPVPKMNPGLLYRSARPDHASPSDLSLLHDTLHIATILDLRSSSEHKALSAPETASAVIPTTNVSLTGWPFRLAILASLPWMSMLWVIGLIIFRRDLAVIKILAGHMAPRGLAGMGRDTLCASWREVRSVFALLSERGKWPVLVHCTQGKDRTGLVVLLLCLLVGVGEEACDQDYMFSQTELEGGREQRLEETVRYGLPEMFVDCEEGWVRKMVGFIDTRWGGVEGYLEWCGVPQEQIQAVKDILRASEE